MRERPILMSGPLVRESLADRKTQTRRPVKPRRGPAGCLNLDLPEARAEALRFCPYGSAGDRLWVRETFSRERLHIYPCPPAWYRADFDPDDYAPHTLERYCEGGDCLHGIRWTPGIHMPRRLCRLVLDVKGVRLERLQSISEEDARAEGVADRAAFAAKWDEIYGAGEWDHSPWVWAITYRRVTT